jgi:hypothetical protein
MLYTLLCYNREDVVWSWSKEEDDTVMNRLSVVHEKLVAGKTGALLRSVAHHRRHHPCAAAW